MQHFIQSSQPTCVLRILLIRILQVETLRLELLNGLPKVRQLGSS